MNRHTWSEELYEPGDAVWLRMGESVYPAVITGVCKYMELHRNGYRCWQYHADVTIPNLEEVHRDAQVSQCMLRRRT